MYSDLINIRTNTCFKLVHNDIIMNGLLNNNGLKNL